MFRQPPGMARLFGPSALLVVALAITPALAAAQSAPKNGSPTPTHTPAPTSPPAPAPTPDDTPSIRLGTTIFSDFTYTQEPTVKDSDGNVIHSNAFDVTRAYLNAAGSLSHLFSFRVTADIRRFSSAVSSPATSIDGSETFRLKYAYGQLSLDSFLPKGSWVRLGAQPTPLIEYEEPIYRYRFQGTQMVERDGFMSSSDFGLGSRVNLPNDYGDIQAGAYNGETYAKGESNDQKSFQIRGTLRPLPKQAILKGLRLTAFYNADHYVKNAPRNRFVANAAFEHKYFVASLDVLDASDQVSARAPLVRSSAYSAWVRLKTTVGLEGLARYDGVKPDKTVDARRNRTILGIAYWFKTKAPVTAAILFDYEAVSYAGTMGKPHEIRYAVHTLFNY